MSDPETLDHKVALITGAARRIGAVIARTLHAQGANVAIHHAAAHDDVRALVAIDVARGGGRRDRRRMRLALAARRAHASREGAIDRYRFLPPAPGADETCSCNLCPYMRKNTVEKLHACMRDRTPELLLDPGLAQRALVPLQRMLDLSR